MKNKTGLVVGIVLGFLAICFAGYMGLMMFSMVRGMYVPPDKRDVIAKNAREVAAEPTELGVTGTLLIEEREELVALDLATQKKTTLMGRSADESVYALAGPNANGVAVAVLNDMMGKSHRIVKLDLKTRQVKTVAARKGDALWQGSVGENVAIARDKNVAVVLKGNGNYQFADPQAYMTKGEIQLINLDTGDVTSVSKDGIDAPMAISEDAKVVWFVSPVDGGKLRALPAKEIVPPGANSHPGIVRWSENGLEPVCAGWGATRIAAQDKLLVQNYGASDYFYNLGTGEVWDGGFQQHFWSIKWMTKEGYFVSIARPTRVEDVEFTKSNGLPGPRPLLRLVVSDPKTDRVVTYYKSLDPRRQWSFGAWSKGK